LIENAFKCAQPRFELTSVIISHFLCVFSTRKIIGNSVNTKSVINSSDVYYVVVLMLCCFRF